MPISANRLPALIPLCVALLLSACGGGGYGGGDGDSGGNPPGSPAPQPGSLQFDAGTLSIDENAGTASLTITRTGGSDGAVSATLASNDGSATAGQDYAALTTTVNFAAGDAAPKAVTIAIADDGQAEAEEALSVTLSAPTGGATLGAIATAALTIRDNDPPSAPVLAVASDIKRLMFTWASAPVATTYRLLQNPNGQSGFTQIGADHAADVTSASLDVVVHRHDWVNARYRLEACNAHGCSASTEIGVLNAMREAIGYFKAVSTVPGNEFGYSVAVSSDGSTLAVGMGFTDEESGGVSVFVRVGSQWSRQTHLTASNPEIEDWFGRAVALSADGSTLAVSAPFEDSFNCDENFGTDNNGAVYIYRRDGTQWPQQACVKASIPGSDNNFGTALALSADGSTLAVGAPGEESDSTFEEGRQQDEDAEDAGAVYVFTLRDAQWSQPAYIKAFNTGEGDEFGTSVALSADGNTLAVGAPFEDSNARGVGHDQDDIDEDNNDASDAGAVYVYSRDDTQQWSRQAYVKASNTEVNNQGMFASDHFGATVALSGDGNTLVVGAPEEDGAAMGADEGNDEFNNDAPDSGAVYVLTRDAAEHWSHQRYVKAFNTQSSDHFGFALALSADSSTLAVGAPAEDSGATSVGGNQGNGVDATGAVYVFTHAETGWLQGAYVKASNTREKDEFGYSLAVSGDGTTLAVGARGEDSSAIDVGGDQTSDDAPEAGAIYMY